MNEPFAEEVMCGEMDTVRVISRPRMAELGTLEVPLSVQHKRRNEGLTIV